MGWGGKRPGAGRPRKGTETKAVPVKRTAVSVEQTTIPAESERLEDSLRALINNKTRNSVSSEEFKQLVHKVAYMEQEVEFIKKIILVSVGG